MLGSKSIEADRGAGAMFMRVFFLAVAFFLTSMGSVAIADVGPVRLVVPVFDDEQDLPVISVHHRFPYGVAVVAAVYPDGRVFWIDGYQEFSGPYGMEQLQRLVDKGPYNAGYISPTIIDQFISSVEQADILKNPGSPPPVLSSSDNSTYVMINTPDKRLRMISKHEWAGSVPGRTMDEDGKVVFLDGKTMEEFLQSQSQEYRKFRENWVFVKDGIIGLIPEAADEVILNKNFQIRMIDATSQRILLPEGYSDGTIPSIDEQMERFLLAPEP